MERIVRCRRDLLALWTSLDMYVLNYKPWSPDGKRGENIRTGIGSSKIGLEDTRNLLKAYQAKEEVFSHHADDSNEMEKITIGAGYVMIAGKEYPLPIARAIISYFQNEMHMHYLEEFGLKRKSSSK